MGKLVYGVGINDMPRGSCTFNGVRQHFYIVWNDSLRRCYNKKYQEKQSAYIGCTVCDEWLTLSNFKEWYDRKYYVKGFQLDKDIIKAGNKVYCPEYCRFIPHNLNSLLLDSGSARGKYMLGVCLQVDNKNGKVYKYWRMDCNDGSGERVVSLHKTELEAHNTWRLQKADVIEDVVKETWIEYPKLDICVKDALLERAAKLRQLDIPVNTFY